EILIDPVIASDKRTYERSAIENLLRLGNGNALSPCTNEILTGELWANYLVKHIIEAYLTKQESLDQVCCPITLTTIGDFAKNLVVASDGYPYDRSSIEAVMKSACKKSP